MFPQLFTHTFTTLEVHSHTRSLSHADTHPWIQEQAWAASHIHSLTNSHTSTSAHRLHTHMYTHSHALDSSLQAVTSLSSPASQLTLHVGNHIRPNLGALFWLPIALS